MTRDISVQQLYFRETTNEKLCKEIIFLFFYAGNIVFAIKPLHNRTRSCIQDVREDVRHPNVE